jgi:RimJ/RimL family protein N-acetyltransferase
MEFMPGRLTSAASGACVTRAAADLEGRGWGLWAVEERDSRELLGCVGFNAPSFEAHFTPCVEIDWRLRRACWGRGFATEAARECLRFGFEVLALPEVVAFTVPQNARSLAITHRAWRAAAGV